MEPIKDYGQLSKNIGAAVNSLIDAVMSEKDFYLQINGVAKAIKALDPNFDIFAYLIGGLDASQQ